MKLTLLAFRQRPTSDALRRIRSENGRKRSRSRQPLHFVWHFVAWGVLALLMTFAGIWLGGNYKH